MNQKPRIAAIVLLAPTIIFSSAGVSAREGQLLFKSQTVLDKPGSPRQMKKQIEQIVQVTQGPVGVRFRHQGGRPNARRGERQNRPRRGIVTPNSIFLNVFGCFYKANLKIE